MDRKAEQGAAAQGSGSEPDRWAQPQDTTGAEMVFGGGMERLLPPMAAIPVDFKRGSNKWIRFQQEWFFSGLKNHKATPKPGVDLAKAWRHLRSIQGSFEPKHEHKEAAVAWLASRWFEDITYEKAAK